jgi:hypothetical protein
VSRCPTLIFQLSIMSKWLAKHISTKVSIKITIRKRHVYIDIRWPWISNLYFYLEFWNDDRTKIIVLPSFQIATRINSQNRNETDFINENCHFNFNMNNSIFNWRCWNFDTTNRKLFTLFQLLSRLLTSNHVNLIST